MAAKKILKPLQWLHKLATINSILYDSKIISKYPLKTPFQRRLHQRKQFLKILISNQPWQSDGDGKFWRAMRWGGAGFLTSQTLHYFLTR